MLAHREDTEKHRWRRARLRLGNALLDLRTQEYLQRNALQKGNRQGSQN